MSAWRHRPPDGARTAFGLVGHERMGCVAAAASARMLGTSIGRRQGNTIVIETDGFPDRLAHGPDLVTSDELRFLERYTLRPDGDTIEVLLMAVDPQVYRWPRISHAFWTRLPEDTFFYPSECAYDPEEHVPYYDPALLESSYIDPDPTDPASPADPASPPDPASPAGPAAE